LFRSIAQSECVSMGHQSSDYLWCVAPTANSRSGSRLRKEYQSSRARLETLGSAEMKSVQHLFWYANHHAHSIGDTFNCITTLEFVKRHTTVDVGTTKYLQRKQSLKRAEWQVQQPHFDIEVIKPKVSLWHHGIEDTANQSLSMQRTSGVRWLSVNLCAVLTKQPTCQPLEAATKSTQD
jgi:hypothetical protein